MKPPGPPRDPSHHTDFGWTPYMLPVTVVAFGWLPCVLASHWLTPWTLVGTIPALLISVSFLWWHQRHLPGVTSWWHR